MAPVKPGADGRIVAPAEQSVGAGKAARLQFRDEPGKSGAADPGGHEAAQGLLVDVERLGLRHGQPQLAGGIGRLGV